MGRLVVITGSPRRDGNSDAMAEAFIAEARGLGHEVVRFDAAFMDVGNCMACETCYSAGRPCTRDDSFTPVAEAVEGADGVVLCTPVYWYSIPAGIKAVIDKFYALVIGERNGPKRCALIACCEEHDESVLDGVRVPYERTAALLGWENVGEVLVTGVLKAGEIAGTDGCERAAGLAKAFRRREGHISQRDHWDSISSD